MHQVAKAVSFVYAKNVGFLLSLQLALFTIQALTPLSS